MVRIRAPDKEIYKGDWEIGFMDRLQAYVDREAQPLKICDVYGSLIFDIIPKEKSSNECNGKTSP